MFFDGGDWDYGEGYIFIIVVPMPVVLLALSGEGLRAQNSVLLTKNVWSSASCMPVQTSPWIAFECILTKPFPLARPPHRQGFNSDLRVAEGVPCASVLQTLTQLTLGNTDPCSCADNDVSETKDKAQVPYP